MKLALLLSALVVATSGLCTEEQMKALPECTGEAPRMGDDGACPTCRIVYKTCTLAEREALPVCTSDVLREEHQIDGSCPPCKIVKTSTCTPEQYRALQPCAPDAVRVPPPVDGSCPLCKFEVKTCTKEQFEAVPDCVGDAQPARQEDNACPSCKIPICDRETLAALPECDGAMPNKGDDGCPTCIPPPIVCSSEDKATCADAPICDLDQVVTRDSCCLSCKPPAPVCTEDKITACKESMQLLPECVPGEEGSFFDPDACCPTCQRPLPDRDPVTTCTLEDFKQCLEFTHECSGTEPPLKLDGQCCASCTRPARKFPIRTVAKCADIPECEGNEEPVLAKGDGEYVCPTCRPARPTCSEACGDDSVCVRDRSGEGVCRKKRVVKLLLRGRNLADKAFIKAASPAELRETLIEIVKRFCDRTENAERCRKYAKALFEGLMVRIKKAGDHETECEVDIPEVDADQGGRRLLNTDGPADLLNDAAKDAEAGDDVMVGRPAAMCPREKLDALEPCAPNTRPNVQDGCPSCVPPVISDECTKEKFMACPAPPACTDNTPPVREGCCMSCEPPQSTCTKEAFTACETKLSSGTLPVCPALIEGDTETKRLDAATCCPTCTRPPRETSGACTLDDFKTCLMKTRECEGDEKPLKEDGQCCFSCRRPASDVPLRDVAKCAKIPECPAGKRPISIRSDDGFACPSCRLARPACDPACDDRQVCVRSREADTAGVCKPRKKRRLLIKAREALDKAFLKEATDDEIRQALLEIVARFCDRTENEAKCASKQALVDGLMVKVTKRMEGTGVECDAEIADDSSRRLARRLLASDDLLDNAMSDPSSNSGITAEDVPVPEEEVSASAVASASLALTLFFALIALF